MYPVVLAGMALNSKSGRVDSPLKEGIIQLQQPKRIIIKLLHETVAKVTKKLTGDFNFIAAIELDYISCFLGWFGTLFPSSISSSAGCWNIESVDVVTFLDRNNL